LERREGKRGEEKSEREGLHVDQRENAPESRFPMKGRKSGGVTLGGRRVVGRGKN
jgi:hypothetical protein